VSGGQGFWQGAQFGYGRAAAAYEESRIELQEDLFKAADELSAQSARLAAEIEARDQLVEEIENEIRTDSNAGNRRPSSGELRRLQRRWGPPP
jgi:septal ring factor EnvC (AmiA/AmiB activator)